VVKDVGVRQPNDGQTPADYARPRPPREQAEAAGSERQIAIDQIFCSVFTRVQIYFN
jgi:hypothetical protein